MDFLGLLNEQNESSAKATEQDHVVKNDIYYMGKLDELKELRVEINKLKKEEEKISYELNEYVLEQHRKNNKPKELFSSKYSLVYKSKNSTEFDLVKLKEKVDVNTLLSVAKFTESGLKSIIQLEGELNECKIIRTENKYQFKDVKGS